MARVDVGDFVKVKGTHVGIVRFVGATKFSPGEWIGIELAEPVGKNSGSVPNVSYFKCKTNCGLFLKSGKESPIEILNNPGHPTSRENVPRKESRKSPMSKSDKENRKDILNANETKDTKDKNEKKDAVLISQVTLWQKKFAESEKMLVSLQDLLNKKEMEHRKKDEDHKKEIQNLKDKALFLQEENDLKSKEIERILNIMDEMECDIRALRSEKLACERDHGGRDKIVSAKKDPRAPDQFEQNRASEIFETLFDQESREGSLDNENPANRESCVDGCNDSFASLKDLPDVPSSSRKEQMSQVSRPDGKAGIASNAVFDDPNSSLHFAELQHRFPSDEDESEEEVEEKKYHEKFGFNYFDKLKLSDSRRNSPLKSEKIKSLQEQCRLRRRSSGLN